MNCPYCKNRDVDGKVVKPLEGQHRVIVNTGKKEHYPSFDLRRYLCTNCGRGFMTKEEYYKDINTQKTLFGSEMNE